MGCFEGLIDGVSVGKADGGEWGCVDGLEEGCPVGFLDGFDVGTDDVGHEVGRLVSPGIVGRDVTGLRVGLLVG